jgi:uncharacterized protein (TIGR03663 family)
VLRINRNLIIAAAIMLAAVIGRTYHIDRRPMHTDEAVHAVKFIDLLERGVYQYDPHEYHGPALYYLTLPIVLLQGKTNAAELDIKSLRFVPLAASLLFFIPLLFLRKIISDRAILMATITAAISPIIIFLSRYYIHETLLAGFMFAAICCAWLYLAERKWREAVAAGIFTGLAIATKETVTLSLTAAAIAFTVTVFSEPKYRNEFLDSHNRRHFILTVTAVITVCFLLYSSFFSNFSGMTDLGEAYFHAYSRAGGQGHEKPWYYYLRLLFYFKDRSGFTATESYIIIAAAITGIAAFRLTAEDYLKRSFVKFLAIYSFTLMFIYSCLPYKMPWLALEWMQPMTLLAGIGTAWITAKNKPILLRLSAGALFIATAAHLIFQIYRENDRFICDTRNPYIYSQTCSDFLRLPKMVKTISDIHPAKTAMPISVISDEYWPIPWYLRNFTAVGYWNSIPDHKLKAPLIITSVDFANELAPQLEQNYTTGIYGLRSGVILVAFVRNDLWQSYLERQNKQ